MTDATCGEDRVCATALNWAWHGLSVAAVLVFLLFSARRRGSLWTERLQAIKETCYLVLETSPISFRRLKPHPWSVYFRQEYAQVRQQYGEVSIFGVAILHAFCTMLMFGQHLLGMTLYTRWWHTMWSAYGCGVVVFARFPRLHHVRGVPVMYLVATTMLCLFVLPVDGFNKQLIILSNAPIMMSFIMLAPLGGLMLSVLSTIVYSVVATLSYLNAPGESVLSIQGYIFWQVSIGGGIMLAGSLCNILYMSNTIRVSIERKLVLEEQKATSSLLSLVCDAVVEIDESGAIVSDAHGLSGLLLHQRSPWARQSSGSKLQDVLYSAEDKEVFDELMREAATKETITIRHLGMRDSMGSLIKTEVFHLSFLGRGSMRYLIGVKEHSDFERVGVAPQQSHGHEGLTSLSSLPSLSSVASPGSGSDGGSSVVSRSWERYMEGTMPTSRRAIDVCLQMVMATWNSGTTARCCQYHRALAELKLAQGRMKSRRCNHNFVLQGLQCRGCGILGVEKEEGDGCPVCIGVEATYPALEEPRSRRRSRRKGAASRAERTRTLPQQTPEVPVEGAPPGGPSPGHLQESWPSEVHLAL